LYIFTGGGKFRENDRFYVFFAATAEETVAVDASSEVEEMKY